MTREQAALLDAERMGILEQLREQVGKLLPKGSKVAIVVGFPIPGEECFQVAILCVVGAVLCEEGLDRFRRLHSSCRAGCQPATVRGGLPS